MSKSSAARRLLCLLLQREGLPSVSTEDGDGAFALLDETGATAVVVDLRSPTEEELVFVSLLRRRRPDVGTLVLHPGRGLARAGRVEHEFAYGLLAGEVLAFPSAEELKTALLMILAEGELARWKPPVAKA